jgi:hypothetical protein
MRVYGLAVAAFISVVCCYNLVAMNGSKSANHERRDADLVSHKGHCGDDLERQRYITMPPAIKSPCEPTDTDVPVSEEESNSIGSIASEAVLEPNVIVLEPEVGVHDPIQEQSMIDDHDTFNLNAFLTHPVVTVLEKDYFVSMSDELRKKLLNTATRKQFSAKLKARLKEISGRSYRSCPIKIAGFNLYLSSNGEDVYSAASKQW